MGDGADVALLLADCAKTMMDVQEFQHLLELGLGRAILYLRDHDARPYRDVILHACLHNLAYDKQCEGNRAEYLFDIIQLTGESEFYRERILTGLATLSDDWDSQLYDLARLFAQHGDAHARQVMYDTFAKSSGEDFYYGHTLIELDGLEGYLFVANCIGDQAVISEDLWIYRNLHHTAEEQCGEDEARHALERASAENSRIQDYLDGLHKGKAQKDHWPPRPNIAGWGYEQLKENWSRGPLPLTQWGKEANNEDLRKVAKDLLAETDEKQIQRLLKIFQKRCFPLEHQRLIEFVSSSDRFIPVKAIIALSHIAHPEIRALAFRLMEPDSEYQGRAVKLLVNNFQESDCDLIEAFIVKLQDVHDLHSVGFDILDFYEAHPNPESESRVMVTLYEKDPCTLCRERNIQRLLALNTLPDWIRAECEYDANPDIRKLVKQP
jgi:hypothetical protein